MSRQLVTFHLGAPSDGRWTARAGLELLGRPVRYGKLGKVGEVVSAVPVDSGRALRLTAELSRPIASPQRRKFRLAKG
jgi:hypothetical protein